MLDELFARQIRRTNRNGLIVAFVMLGITLVPGWHYRRYLLSLFRPPLIASGELNSSIHPNPFLDSFVVVSADTVLDTGAQEVARDSGGGHSSGDVLANVVGIKIGDRFLLAKVPVRGVDKGLTGELVEMPADVRKTIITDHLAQHPELEHIVYPYLLDATVSRLGDSWAFLTLGGLFSIVGVCCLVQGCYRLAHPDTHPVMKALQRYGEPSDVSIQIAQELRVEGDREKYGAARITSHWLFQAMALKTDIMRLSDILWAYPKVTKHYHSFIPTGKTYSLIVRDRAGQSVEISVKKDQSPAMVATLQRRTPWAIYGFDAKLDNVWRKQRGEMIRAVDQRKAALDSAKTAASSEPEPVLANS